MKKIKRYSIICTICVTTGLLLGNAVSGENIEGGHYSEESLFEYNTIEAHNEDCEEYVELNNELSGAIDDYLNGKITEGEYLERCKKVNKKIDTESEEKKIKKSEDAYIDYVGE